MVTICFACGASPKKMAEKIIFDFSNSSIYVCPDCRLLWRFPLPPQEKIDHYYSINTFRFSDDIQKQLAESQRDFILGSIPRSLAESRFNFIEYGAGNGWLVKIMSDSSSVGYALGIEPDKESVEMAKKRLKVNMYTGFINQFRLNESDSSRTNLIAMSHVMEHLSSPLSALKFLKEEFSRHLIFIEVPDGDEESEVIMNDVYFPTSLDQHLWAFNLKNLRRILENEGYSIISSEKLGKKNYWKISKISNRIIQAHMEISEGWKNNSTGPGVSTLLSYSKLFLMTCKLGVFALSAKIKRNSRLAYPSIRVLASYQK